MMEKEFKDKIVKIINKHKDIVFYSINDDYNTDDYQWYTTLKIIFKTEKKDFKKVKK